jgi:hypothetical protein
MFAPHPRAARDARIAYSSAELGVLATVAFADETLRDRIEKHGFVS